MSHGQSQGSRDEPRGSGSRPRDHTTVPGPPVLTVCCFLVSRSVAFPASRLVGPCCTAAVYDEFSRPCHGSTKTRSLKLPVFKDCGQII